MKAQQKLHTRCRIAFQWHSLLNIAFLRIVKDFLFYWLFDTHVHLRKKRISDALGFKQRPVISKQLWIFQAILSQESIDNCSLHRNLKIKFYSLFLNIFCSKHTVFFQKCLWMLKGWLFPTPSLPLKVWRKSETPKVGNPEIKESTAKVSVCLEMTENWLKI